MTGPDAMADTASRRTLWQLATHWAGTHPDRPVIVHRRAGAKAPSSISWETFTTETAELRHRLAAVGVGDQRTVVVALPNEPLTVALWSAIMANNAIVQAIDVAYGALVFERAIRATNPVVVIAARENARTAAQAIATAGSTARLVVPDDLTLDGGYAAIEGLGTGKLTPEETTPESLAGMLPTSGTSGMPKLVELTTQNYVMAGERLARNSGYTTDDRHYVCSPFFHTNAQLYLCTPPFITGGSMALVPRFSASGYFSSARELGATISSMVAPPLRLALHHAIERGTPVDAGALRLIQYGMTLSAADWDEWDRRVPGVHMRQIYGQTESVTGVLGGAPWDRDDRETIGLPFVGVPAVRVVAEDGSDAPDGEPGELWVNGRPGSTLMRGYHDSPGATATAIPGGEWLRTGDVMLRRPNGRLEFRGRQAHIIRRGGENLSTYALEVDLQSCPFVRDVAVTARADDRLDALVVAHVIPAAGYSEEAFLAWCRESLGKRGVPDHVREHVSFPRTGSGRVIARELDS